MDAIKLSNSCTTCCGDAVEKGFRPVHHRRFPPAIKVDGKMTPVSNQKLTQQHTKELARSIMNDKQSSEFEASRSAISPSVRQISDVSASAPLSSRADRYGAAHHYHRDS